MIPIDPEDRPRAAVVILGFWAVVGILLFEAGRWIGAW